MFIGMLDKRITVSKMQRVFDGRGGWTEREVQLGKFWASVQPLGISERVQYSQLDAQITLKVYVRYNPQFDSNTYITFQGKRYRVQGVINPAFQNNFTELVVSEA